MAFLTQLVASNSTLKRWLPAFGIVLASFAVYFPAIPGGEIWDDRPNITDNPLLHNLDGLWEMWTNVRSMPAYYPVSHTSWWIDYQLFGLKLAFYHLENIAMHAASAVLIWLVLRRLSVTGAWLAGALWALHPIHVESVAWITERKNTLSVLLYLLSFLCYLRASGLGERSHDDDVVLRLNKNWYIASLALFAVALPAKTPVVTLPAAILLAWWYRRGDRKDFWRVTFRRELLRMIPFFALGLCMGVATVLIEQQHTGAKGPLFDFSPMQRLVIAGRSFWFYAWKVIWPTHFNFIYPRWNISPHVSLQIGFPLAALGLLVALVMLRRRIGRGPAAGVLFYAGTAFPALGFAPIFFHRYSLVSDHFAYLCNAGLLALIAWAIVRSLRGRRMLLCAVSSLTLAGLSVQSVHQATLYKDNFTMWSDVLAKNPSAWLARGNLAQEMLARGRDREAGRLLLEQYVDAPDEVETALGYANYLSSHGQLDEAAALYEHAIALKPEFLNTYGFFGRSLKNSGRRSDALKLYQQTLARHPEWEAGWIDLAEIHEQAGNPAFAAEAYQKAIAAVPASVGARINLANLYLKAGNVPPALALFKQAAALADDNADIHNRYGLLLLQLGQYSEAAEQFQRMVDLTKGKDGAHIAYHNLATALEGAGRISEAVISYRRALAIKPDFEPAKRNLQRALEKPR